MHDKGELGSKPDGKLFKMPNNTDKLLEMGNNSQNWSNDRKIYNIDLNIILGTRRVFSWKRSALKGEVGEIDCGLVERKNRRPQKGKVEPLNVMILVLEIEVVEPQRPSDSFFVADAALRKDAF